MFERLYQIVKPVLADLGLCIAWTSARERPAAGSAQTQREYRWTTAHGRESSIDREVGARERA
jgi:hypothetical protein